MASSLIDRLKSFPLQRLTNYGMVCGYRTAGSGPALVLLHGIGSGSGSWVQQLEALAGRFRVIAWDAPGYGETASLAQDVPSAADYAAVLSALLDGLDVERCYLLGHSLGALIAATFAGSFPERVTALILANPALGYGAAAQDVRESKLQARLQHMARLGPAALADERAPALLSQHASPEALELVRWNMSRLHPGGYAQAARLLAKGELLAHAADYSGPVLVLWGAEDRITPEDGARRVAAAYAHACYRRLPGAGHASYIETPEAFHRDLLGFIEELK